MKGIFFLICLLCAISVIAQNEDTTRYTDYPNVYGEKKQRGWFTKLLRIPDTARSLKPKKKGVIATDSTGTKLMLYDGTDWVPQGNTTNVIINDSTFIDARYIPGVNQIVNDTIERNNLSYAIRREGMTAYVKADSSTYRLVGGVSNGNWTKEQYNLISTSIGGNALIVTIEADGLHTTIPLFTGSNRISSVQTITPNGSGIRYFNNPQYSDTTYIYYDYAPKDTVTYILSVAGTIDTTELVGLQTPILTADSLGITSIGLTTTTVPFAANYEIEYSYDAINYGFLVDLLPDDTTFTHTNLAANSQYYYRGRARNTLGGYRSSSFSYATATTGALATLTTPLFSVISDAPTRNILSWQPVNNAIGYNIKYSTDKITWTDIGSYDEATLNIIHEILNPDTKYYYELIAIANNVNFSNSQTVLDSATTLSLVFTTLGTPNLNASAITDTSILLQWPSVPDAAYYVIDYLSGDEWLNIDTVYDNTLYTHAILTANTLYSYRLQAGTAADNFINSAYSYDTATTLPATIAQPTTLAAPVLAASAINTTSNHITVNDLPNRTGTTIERSLDKQVWQLVTVLNATGTAFNDVSLQPATKYYYRAFFNANGTTFLNSDYSNTDSATTNDIIKLATPVNVNATPTGTTQNTITWNLVSNASNYRIQWSLNKTSWTNINLLGATISTYKHNSLQAATKYYYRVRALPATGSTVYSISDWSLIDSATTFIAATILNTPVITATAINSTTISVSLNNVPNRNGYAIERSLDSSAWGLVATLSGSATYYTDAGLQPGTKYYYRAYAIGNNTTYLNSAYAGTSAVTQVTTVNYVTRFGVLSNSTGSGLTEPVLTAAVADSLGTTHTRTSIVLSQSSNPGGLSTLHDAGKTAMININSYPANGTRSFTTTTERSDFVSKVYALFTNYLINKRDTLIVASNEENNMSYRDNDTAVNSPTNGAFLYAMNELKVIDSIAKLFGPGRFKTANGAFTGKGMWFIAYVNLLDSGRTVEAAELAQAVFTPGEIKTLATMEVTGPLAKVIKMERQLLAYYKILSFDYFNVHITMPINGVDSSHINKNAIKYLVQAYTNLTCKPIICTELASTSIVPSVSDDIASACFESNMQYVYWYDGTSYITNATSAGIDVSLRLETDKKTINSIGTAIKTRYKIIRGL